MLKAIKHTSMHDHNLAVFKADITSRQFPWEKSHHNSTQKGAPLVRNPAPQTPEASWSSAKVSRGHSFAGGRSAGSSACKYCAKPAPVAQSNWLSKYRKNWYDDVRARFAICQSFEKLPASRAVQARGLFLLCARESSTPCSPATTKAMSSLALWSRTSCGIVNGGAVPLSLSSVSPLAEALEEGETKTAPNTYT